MPSGGGQSLRRVQVSDAARFGQGAVAGRTARLNARYPVPLAAQPLLQLHKQHSGFAA